jgi:hypothetical protein
MCCYLAHNLRMVIFLSILQSCAHVPMFCGLYVFSNFYNFLLPFFCSFYGLLYSLCFYKMCSLQVVILTSFLQLVLQAHDVIMCTYDANESSRMCDVPMFFSNEDAFFIFETMNNALILHHY